MAEIDFKYDVFISYSHKDEKWVVSTLLPCLEDSGLKVCIDFRDFVPGKPSRHNMRDACKASAYTVLVMTPAWMVSEWTEFEGLLTLLHDPSGNRQRTIPILLERCDIPEDIQIFTYIDFTRRDREVMEWQRLLKACGTDGKFKLIKRKKNKTSKEYKRTAQLILDGDYDSFDEKTLIAALAGMLNVDKKRIQILHTGKGSIVIDLELPAQAAELLISMALENNVQLRTLGIRSVQLEGQNPISVTNIKDWFLAHPYPMPANFTGRHAEQQMLDKWLSDDTNRLLILRALGGFGKSALTWQWINTHVNPSEWTKLVWWSFYEGDASFEHFIEETLKYLKLEVPQGQRPQVDELLKAMQSQKILLIMDGFERALRAYSNMNAAYQGDEEPKLDESYYDCININAQIFLQKVCSLPGIKGKVLMTTRLTPRAVKPHDDFLQGCLEKELKEMGKADAVGFFKAQGIKGTNAEIETACASYGFHPLSLRLLSGRVLKDFENPADIVVAQKIKIDGDIIQQKHHVLEVSYNSLYQHEQRLLSMIACFRSSVELKTLQSIAESKDTLDYDLHDLMERGLLHFDDKNKRFDFHPIVRRYAYERLTVPDRTNTHERLVNYFEAVPKPKKVQTLDDLAPVIELYHHTVRSGELVKARELFRDRLKNPLYFQMGAYQTIIELLRVLFVNGEDSPPHLEDEAAQAWTLNLLALAYSLNGQPDRGISLFMRHNKLQEINDRPDKLAVGLTNLAENQLKTGALRTAELNLKRSTELFQVFLDERDVISRQSLGRLLAFRGVWHKAKLALDKSILQANIRRQIQMQGVIWSSHALYTMLMSRDLAQSSIENRKSVIMYAQRALELAEEDAYKSYPVEFDFVRAYWLLGAGYRLNNQLDLAEQHLSEALTRDRTINMVESEADILLDLARLRYDQANYEEAKNLAEEALTITERCGYVLQGADVNLFLAQYALEQEKDKGKAKQYAEEAKTLATCDGPPYYYKVAYEEAERMLEKLK